VEKLSTNDGSKKIESIAPIVSGTVYDESQKTLTAPASAPTSSIKNDPLSPDLKADKKAEVSRNARASSSPSENSQSPCGAGYINLDVCIGRIHQKDGGTYVGEILLGKREGRGTTTWPDGETHVGFYKYDRPYGKGTHTRPDGEKFVGEFKDHGWTEGTRITKDGVQYVGEFRGDGKQTGQGSVTSPDGFKYVGAFRDGRRNGEGTSIWPDGTKYVGEHRDDKPHGQGTGTFPNGDKYVGEHMNGERHGQGALTTRSGDTYTGAFKRNMKHGRGTVTYADGRPALQGDWAEGKFVQPIKQPSALAEAKENLKSRSKGPTKEPNGGQTEPEVLVRSFPHSGDDYQFSIQLDGSWTVEPWSLETQQKDNQVLGIAFGIGDTGILQPLEAKSVLSSGSSNGRDGLRIQLIAQVINTRNALMAGKEVVGMSQREIQRELDKLTKLNELLLTGDNVAFRRSFDSKGECKWLQTSSGTHFCRPPFQRGHESVMGASVSMLEGIILSAPMLDGVFTFSCSLVDIRLPMSPAVGYRERHEATKKTMATCEQLVKTIDLKLQK
jgi:hypothetical protein